MYLTVGEIIGRDRSVRFLRLVWAARASTTRSSRVLWSDRTVHARDYRAFSDSDEFRSAKFQTTFFIFHFPLAVLFYFCNNLLMNLSKIICLFIFIYLPSLEFHNNVWCGNWKKKKFFKYQLSSWQMRISYGFAFVARYVEICNIEYLFEIFLFEKRTKKHLIFSTLCSTEYIYISTNFFFFFKFLSWNGEMEFFSKNRYNKNKQKQNNRTKNHYLQITNISIKTKTITYLFERVLQNIIFNDYRCQNASYIKDASHKIRWKFRVLPNRIRISETTMCRVLMLISYIVTMSKSN